jgi:hypothetical protein
MRMKRTSKEPIESDKQVAVKTPKLLIASFVFVFSFLFLISALVTFLDNSEPANVADGSFRTSSSIAPDLVAQTVSAQSTNVTTACGTDSPLRLSVDSQIADTYNAWIRVATLTDEDVVTDARLEIGGQCHRIDSISSRAWQWVGIDDTVNLEFGAQTAEIHTPSTTLLVDKLLFTRDRDCIPNDSGENCIPFELSISLRDPIHGAEVSGDITIEALLTSNIATAEVSFYLDDQTEPVTVQSFSPYCLVNSTDEERPCGAWNTSVLENGEHTLTAEVSVEGQSTRVTQTFNVNNQLEAQPIVEDQPTITDPETPVQKPHPDNQPSGDLDEPEPEVPQNEDPDESEPIVISPIIIPATPEAEIELDRDTEAEADTDTDTDAVVDTDTDTDTDSESVIDTGSTSGDDQGPEFTTGFSSYELPITALVVGETDALESDVIGVITLAPPLDLIENKNFSDVKYFINGEIIGTADAENPLVTLDSSEYENGEYVLSAQISYLDGQRITVRTTIYIQNVSNAFVALVKNNLLVTGLLTVGTLIYAYFLILSIYRRYFATSVPQDDVLDTNNPYPRQPEKQSLIEALPGKVYSTIKSQYVARPLAVLFIGAIVLANGFVLAATLQSDPIFVGGNGFIIEAEEARTDDVHVIKSFEGQLYMEIVPTIAPEPVPEPEPQPEPTPDPVTPPPSSQLPLDTPDVARNTNVDIRQQWRFTPSDQIPFNEFVEPWNGTGGAQNINNACTTNSKCLAQFRTQCSFSHFGYNDPIVFPGQENRAHLHMFFGNTQTDHNSTEQSLKNSGNSTCNGLEGNRTGYWFPAVFDQRGNVRVPSGIEVYYKSHGSADKHPLTNDFPDDFKMISGNANGANNTTYVQWACDTGQISANLNAIKTNVGPTIPNCPAGQSLEAHLWFPQCIRSDWRSTDSWAEARNKISYSQGSIWDGNCPAGTTKIPLVELFIDYDTAAQDGSTADWFVASDVTAGLDRGRTLHSDWYGGWNDRLFDQILDNCITRVAECSWDLVENGVTLTRVEHFGNRHPVAYNGPAAISAEAISRALCPGDDYNKVQDAATCESAGGTRID